MVFYDAYTPERAAHWLARREKVTDPEHNLNKNPLLTLMLMSKWFHESPEYSQQHPKAVRWTEQLLSACVAWEWPANSTSTELYYRLGHMLSAAHRLEFLHAWPHDDARFGPLLAWCTRLEDTVRPTISAAIMYQLQDDGIGPHAPQDAVVDSVLAHLMTTCAPGQGCEQHSVQNMGILWQSSQVLESPHQAYALAHKVPTSLPAAIERCLVRRACNETMPPSRSDILRQHSPIFGMDPSCCDPVELLDALLLSYEAMRNNAVHSPTHHLWDTLCQVWPQMTGVLQTTVAMMGAESIAPTHPMRSTLVGYIVEIQQEQMPPILEVQGMFEAESGFLGT